MSLKTLTIDIFLFVVLSSLFWFLADENFTVKALYKKVK